MPLTLTWGDISLRILLTVLAGMAMGFDRRALGRPAGTRTTTLVALAACLAMLQANWLMNSVGKTPSSFVVLDLMRLPLGILTGVGFIGAGAILKRGDSVLGLTTAASLWFVTVVGLCFGGGQIALGAIGAVLGVGALRGLQRFEQQVEQERASHIRIKWSLDAFDAQAALAALESSELKIASYAVLCEPLQRVQELQCEVRRRRLPREHDLPPAFLALTQRPGVIEWEWKD